MKTLQQTMQRSSETKTGEEIFPLATQIPVKCNLGKNVLVKRPQILRVKRGRQKKNAQKKKMTRKAHTQRFVFFATDARTHNPILCPVRI